LRLSARAGRGAAWAWTLLITLLTLMPGKDLPPVGLVGFDKLAHLGVFAVMVALHLGVGTAVTLRASWRGVRVAGACALYGGLIELLQGALTADRVADPYDAMANALGCGLALLVVRAVDARRRGRSGR
jgi:VanZ family protein